MNTTPQLSTISDPAEEASVLPRERPGVLLASLGKREKRAILRENRGLLAQVAEELAVYLSGVSAVYWGKCKSARIAASLERRLRPILAERRAAA